MIAPNNSNLASQGRMSGTILDTLTKWLRGSVDDMLPARVIEYSAVEGRATVQPIIMMGTTDGQKVSRAAVADVPVFRFGGGGLVMSVPLNPGDLGWLKASDRDISLFKQHGIEDWPNTARLHSFEDAMFFPDAMRNVVLGDAAALCIQTIDGVAGLFMTPEGVLTMKTASASVTISEGTVSILADSVAIESGSLTHNGVNVGHDHTHDGPASAPDGPVSPTGPPQ